MFTYFRFSSCCPLEEAGAVTLLQIQMPEAAIIAICSMVCVGGYLFAYVNLVVDPFNFAECAAFL